MSQVVSENSSIFAELIGLFFITILVTGLIVYTDTKFFDNYVLGLISKCYADNHEQICMEKRHEFGLADNAQIELGNPYWQVLMVQYFVIPIGFAGFRFLTIAVRKRKITALRIFIILLWGFVPLILLTTGVIDLFYYVGRGLEIPDQLNWLNHVGIFEQTKVFGNDPLNVERSDLLFTFALGVIFIVLLFFFAVKMYENSKLRGFV